MKAMQPHLVFNQDLLQLQYKQMKTLLEIEKKRLVIEEDRLREEKEANNRTSAFLLEAVKILAETFRKEGSKNVNIADNFDVNGNNETINNQGSVSFKEDEEEEDFEE